MFFSKISVNKELNAHTEMVDTTMRIPF